MIWRFRFALTYDISTNLMSFKFFILFWSIVLFIPSLPWMSVGRLWICHLSYLNTSNVFISDTFLIQTMPEEEEFLANMKLNRFDTKVYIILLFSGLMFACSFFYFSSKGHNPIDFIGWVWQAALLVKLNISNYNFHTTKHVNRLQRPTCHIANGRLRKGKNTNQSPNFSIPWLPVST